MNNNMNNNMTVKEEVIKDLMERINEWESADKSAMLEEILPKLSLMELRDILNKQS